MYVPKIDSTNTALSRLLQQTVKLPDGFTLYTYRQTAGRGQQGNTWESEAGKNLLFSTLIRPVQLPIEEQFLLSQMVALAIRDVLTCYASDISIKWPNDIYWHDKKICGILIETTWVGNNVVSCIAGAGVNLNQTVFVSDAPNPVSLKQITGSTYDKRSVLHQILDRLSYYKQFALTDKESIRNLYHAALYRREGLWTFSADGQKFEANIENILPDGKLQLRTDAGLLREFYFKEVGFVI